jgi:hypothetical protein
MEANLAKKKQEAERQKAEMDRRASMRQSAPPPRDMSNPGPPPRAREKYHFPQFIGLIVSTRSGPGAVGGFLKVVQGIRDEWDGV